MRHNRKAGQEAAKPEMPVFVDLPDMIANLAGPPAKPSYVKLQARLELSKQEDVDKVKQSMPRLQDMFQTYLREMRPDELRGSAGIYRLREELLGRANVALAPVRVNDVLFTQLLIQ
jgi:flagellar FliL protein